jgi:DNA-binding XRE family transcriptional regulator
MAQLAQEKTEQVLQLERVRNDVWKRGKLSLSILSPRNAPLCLSSLRSAQQLSQSQSQLTALDAANSALREENRQLQARLDKTAHALRIAGQNATKAREDAAQAETTAAALSDQLQALQAAAGETKQTIEALTKEHRDISEDVRKVEARLVRALAKDAATTARHRELEARRAALEAQAEESRRDAAAWRGRHERSLETIRDLERGLDRAAEHSSARRAHSEQLAADHQNAVALLEASTRANRESDEALRQLREANGNLKEELASQASVLSEHRTTAQREKDRLNESFTKALAKAQHLELQLETLKAGAAAKEQEWQRERRTLMSMVASHDGSAGGGGGGSDDSGHGHGGAASATATPATRAADHPTPTFTGSGAEAASTAASWAPASAYASRIPPLSAFFGGGDRSRPKFPSLGSTKTPPPSSSSAAAAADCCVVCLKPANTGLVVTCRCGRGCGKRGHAGCVSATTVIASTPLILCDSDGTGDSSSLGVGGGSRRGSAESGPWGPGV